MATGGKWLTVMKASAVGYRKTSSGVAVEEDRVKCLVEPMHARERFQVAGGGGPSGMAGFSPPVGADPRTEYFFGMKDGRQTRNSVGSSSNQADGFSRSVSVGLLGDGAGKGTRGKDETGGSKWLTGDGCSSRLAGFSMPVSAERGIDHSLSSRKEGGPTLNCVRPFSNQAAGLFLPGAAGGLRDGVGSSSRDKDAGSRVLNQGVSGLDIGTQSTVFTAYVDGVSKRLRKGRLLGMFAEFGVVVDGFVAYRSLKRRLRDFTFAFVRFREESGLLNVIKHLNNKRVDGFVLRVSRARFVRKPIVVPVRDASPLKQHRIGGGTRG